MTLKCYHCGAETSNGLALCEACRAAVSVHLEFIPVYFRNLSRWRPGRAGGRPVPGSRAPQGVFPAPADNVQKLLEEVHGDLLGWARVFEDDRGIEVPEADDEPTAVARICRTLTEHLTSVSLLEWCGDFAAETGRHEGRLRALTMRVVPGWYAGSCRQCEAPTFVVPGLTWVTCGACGVTTYARDHLETILDEARGWEAPPMRIAEALVALLDTELSVPRLYERIKKSGQRGTIDTLRRTDAEGDEIGPKRHRLGEVLDMVLSEGATRADVVTGREAC